MTDPRENQWQPWADGPADSTGRYGHDPRATYRQPLTNRPGVGSRLMAFLTRDMIAAVAGIVTVVAGILLLITPRLAWLVDRSFDIVEGTMSISATGAIDLSSAAQRGLSDSDALELGIVEMSTKMLLEPVAGMLALSGVLVIVGGLLMLTTARQLGAVFAVIGVVPQLFVLAIGVLVVAIVSDDTPPAPGSPATSGPDVEPGAGPILTVATYVVVIGCAIVAVLRHGEHPRPAVQNAPGPNGPTGAGEAGEYGASPRPGSGAPSTGAPRPDPWGPGNSGTQGPGRDHPAPGDGPRYS
ncbi:hypothetical protein H483_0112200 [Dietzia sp. UCD-THP]|uniref:hypothetical protein n=1 Tax=Dietzia sp. UCD-THP TaxID=1292020 RepID=UPI0003A0B309|nr:hypothetical protein [Dietzia sp. UCD-THP]EYT61942.1 hypothetical protein H483_0112200 [Dietzia sp. UCD-THP]